MVTAIAQAAMEKLVPQMNAAIEQQVAVAVGCPSSTTGDLKHGRSAVRIISKES